MKLPSTCKYIRTTSSSLT